MNSSTAIKEKFNFSPPFFNKLKPLLSFWELHQKLRAKPGLSAGTQALTLENEKLKREIVKVNQELEKVTLLYHQKIKELKASHLHFFSHFSHEIRSTLLVLRHKLMFAKEGERINPEELHQEVQRISQLLEDIILLSKAKTGCLSSSLKPASLSWLVQEIVWSLESMAQSQGVTIKNHLKEQFLLPLESFAFKRALFHLLLNALMYNKRGGLIEIYGKFDLKTQKSPKLVILDTGIGFKEESRQVLSCFFRGVEARQKFPKGNGLGLAVASAVIEAHQGSLELKSQFRQGTAAVINLNPSPSLPLQSPVQ